MVLFEWGWQVQDRICQSWSSGFDSPHLHSERIIHNIHALTEIVMCGIV